MAAYQQLLYHIVFSTKHRRPLLQNDKFREGVWAYMAGVVQNLGGFAIQVGGYHDHAHLLLRIPAKVSVCDFVGKVKANTSKHINDSRHTVLKFRWQAGYGVFSVSFSKKQSVISYIENQLEHHRVNSFQDEFRLLLHKHKVEYDEKYIWE
ncbi:MAG: IS200/IS605 family transposase [Fuerstiella sp.]